RGGRGGRHRADRRAGRGRRHRVRGVDLRRSRRARPLLLVARDAGEGGPVSADVGVDFARASAVTSAALVDGQGTYDIAVDPGWVIGDKPNGGCLLATMARAAVAATGT